jgi:hypothetical protein
MANASLEPLQHGDLSAVLKRMLRPVQFEQVTALPHAQAGACHVHRQVKERFSQRVDRTKHRGVHRPAVAAQQRPVDRAVADRPVKAIMVIGKRLADPSVPLLDQWLAVMNEPTEFHIGVDHDMEVGRADRVRGTRRPPVRLVGSDIADCVRKPTPGPLEKPAKNFNLSRQLGHTAVLVPAGSDDSDTSCPIRARAGPGTIAP